MRIGDDSGVTRSPLRVGLKLGGEAVPSCFSTVVVVAVDSACVRGEGYGLVPMGVLIFFVRWDGDSAWDCESLAERLGFLMSS